MGVEPGLSDVFARYAQDHLFTEIDECGVRDGANLTVDGYDFAPSFSIWTTIEECLNPPVIWERGRDWYTTPPFSEPETFDFPEGIGPVECVNVEHEEVLLIPRWVKARRVTFKYGLGDEFINVLKTLHKLGLDKTAKVRVGGVEVSPRDVVAAVLPDPATLGDRMHGKTCAGTWVTGTGKDGKPREVYLYHVVDNDWSMREYGSQAVVWQTAVNPVVALELLAHGQVVGLGRARARGVRCRAVPRPADRVRLALGHARGLIAAAGLRASPARPRAASAGPASPPPVARFPASHETRWHRLGLAPWHIPQPELPDASGVAPRWETQSSWRSSGADSRAVGRFAPVGSGGLPGGPSDRRRSRSCAPHEKSAAHVARCRGRPTRAAIVSGERPRESTTSSPTETRPGVSTSPSTPKSIFARGIVRAEAAVADERPERVEVALAGVRVLGRDRAARVRLGDRDRRATDLDRAADPGVLLVGRRALELDQHPEPAAVDRRDAELARELREASRPTRG